MNKLARYSLTLAALGLASQTSLRAATLIEETFAYDPGNVAGNNGGTGFAGAWVSSRGNPQIEATDKGWGDLDSGGGHARGGAWSGVTRSIGSTLSSAGLMDNGTTLWFSVVMDLQAQNISNADLNLSLGSAAFVNNDFGNRENLASGEGIGVTHSRANIQGVYWQDIDADTVAERTENNSSLTINGDAGDTSSGVNTRALIAGRIDWGADASASETLTLYAPALDLSLGTPIMAAWTIPALDQSVFDTLAVQFKDQAQIDEIRFGATAADVLPTSVIPEPSSALLMALGAAGMILRRRRH